MKPFFKKNQTVLFQGDSTTDCGRNRNDFNSLAGYSKKVADIYNSLFQDNKVNFINRGISGDRTCNLLMRYDKDFKQLNPDFLSILIGINDVWRRYDSDDETTCEQFKKNYKQLLTQIKKDMPNTKIMLIVPFLLHSMPEKIEWHVDLDPKIQVVRKLAKELADYYLDMDSIFTRLCVTTYEPSEIALDGVHPTDLGNSIIAYEYLKVLDII